VFWPDLHSCTETVIFKLPIKIEHSDIAIRFSDPDFSGESTNLAINQCFQVFFSLYRIYRSKVCHVFLFPAYLTQ